MDSEWKETTIGELKTLITKGTTPPKGKGFVEQGINFIKSESISYDGKIDTSKFAFIDNETHDNFKRSQIQKDDILFSMAGAFLGKNAVVSEELLPANTNQALAIIRIDKTKALPNFISYCLRNPSMISYVNSMSAQSAQPNINFQEISSLPINLPPLPEQKAIAHILGSLDDKIELNRKMNQTLEHMAQAMFKSWFVDFDPVIDNALAQGNPIPDEFAERAERRKEAKGKFKALPDNIQKLFPSEFEETEEMGWIPKGWKVGRISDVGKVITGKTPPSKNPEHFGNKYPFVTPTDFKNYFKIVVDAERKLSDEGYKANKVRILPPNSVIVTCIGSDMGKVVINKIECLTNQQINSVIPDTEWITTEYLYHFFVDIYDHLRTLAFGGSTMPILNKSDFESIQILIPNQDLLNSTSKYLQDIDLKIEKNVFEIQTLTQQRDTLLPRLISGKLRVG